MATMEFQETKDHKTIQNWIQKNNGVPARLGYDSVDNKLKDPLTVWFRAEKNEFRKTYQELDWEEFFAVFDYHNFVFKFTDESEEDQKYKIVKNER